MCVYIINFPLPLLGVMCSVLAFKLAKIKSSFFFLHKSSVIVQGMEQSNK